MTWPRWSSRAATPLTAAPRTCNGHRPSREYPPSTGGSGPTSRRMVASSTSVARRDATSRLPRQSPASVPARRSWRSPRGVSARVAPGATGPSRGPERMTSFGSGSRASLVIFAAHRRPAAGLAGAALGRLGARLRRSGGQHERRALVPAQSGAARHRPGVRQLPGRARGGDADREELRPLAHGHQQALRELCARARGPERHLLHLGGRPGALGGRRDSADRGATGTTFTCREPRRDRPELPARRL